MEKKGSQQIPLGLNRSALPVPKPSYGMRMEGPSGRMEQVQTQRLVLAGAIKPDSSKPFRLVRGLKGTE